MHPRLPLGVQPAEGRPLSRRPRCLRSLGGGPNPPKQEEPPKAWAAPKRAAQKAWAAPKREREQFSSYSQLHRMLAVHLNTQRADTTGLSGARGRHRAAPCRRCTTASAGEGSRHDHRGGMQHAVLPSAARAALVLHVLFHAPAKTRHSHAPLKRSSIRVTLLGMKSYGSPPSRPPPLGRPRQVRRASRTAAPAR